MPDTRDNCPLVVNTDQADGDQNGIGDACENDQDGDTIADDADNCPSVANTNQADLDDDNIGDSCDDDVDGDGTLSQEDCDDRDAGVADEVFYFSDNDQDSVGEAGTGDTFCSVEAPEGYTDSGTDNCPEIANSDQLDSDQDGQGDACDESPTPEPTDTPTPDATATPTPGDPTTPDQETSSESPTQADTPTEPGTVDPSPTVEPTNQPTNPEPSSTPAPAEDSDSDGVQNGDDNCPTIANPDQADEDNDGVGDLCEDGEASPTDVDTNASGSGGCGCSQGDGSQTVVSMLAFLLTLAIGRRRNRPSP